MQIVVYGIGYVGSVTAGCLAKMGHHVSVTDPVTAKLELIQSAQSPVLEPSLDEVIAEGLRMGNLRIERDPLDGAAKADLAMVCVGTPSLRSGLIDTKALRRVLESIAAGAARRTAALPVVIRSTILPTVLRPILADIEGGDLLLPVVNPEFLRETTAVADFFSPPFIVVGADDPQAAKTTLQVYDGIDAPRYVVSLETASMLKYACNSFHALKIAFANEIDTLASLIHADGRKVMELLSQDTKLNISPKYLRPGFAFGGSCLPKDLRALEALAQEHHEPLSLISSVLPSNRRRIEQALELILSNPGQRLAFIGLSFKQGSDDLRESPYVELAERLLGKGFELKVYDPDLDPARLIGTNRAHALERLPHLARILVGSIEQACHEVDGIVLCKPLVTAEEIKKSMPIDAQLYDLERLTDSKGVSPVTMAATIIA